MIATVTGSPKSFAQQFGPACAPVPGVAGRTMDSIIHLEVFLCLPLSDGIRMPTGKVRFDAHKAQYDALNKIYGTYFNTGKAPSRACMALE
jgi:hypothetical protein